MDEVFGVTFSGAALACRSQGDGLPIVFLHAGVCDSRMWADQMAAATAEGFRAIAYDRRGYGETTSSDVSFSHLDDLEAVLRALNIHAAILVGCSLGGGLALDFALKHPGRVIGLVLMGTSVAGAPYDLLESEHGLEMAEADAVERGDLDMLNLVHAHEWLDGPRAQNGRVGGDARRLFLDMNAKALKASPLTQEQARPPAYELVDVINAPTLLIVGDQDFNSQIQLHEYLSEEMPNAFAVVLENVAHIPSIERPDLVNPLLVEFLDAVVGTDDDEDEDEQAE
ncbi:alpha/beta hydrolase [Devosia rhodophyticola]|uniref:Alpha/beta hydrolase n=1 Tax=Devosia rhodophyticola TaxID=3026423 RepID=A0ABY7YVC0_9HYPH|nr:alpha/beta hydrolase [Devosia rhodophyticola]WDR05313.1 alpha/beta hydrolase [Devosia rhodophyticola]